MKVQNPTLPTFSRIAAALLVVAGIQYLVLEAIAAAAWQHPVYNYAYNFISDLGNPVAGDVFAGRTIDSPLNVVMDIAFVLQGVLFIAAAILVYRRIPGRVRIVLLVMSILHGVGVILVGFFHESTAALTNGVIVVHGLSAASTIVFGNVIVIVIGIIGVRLFASGWYRVVSIALGIIGLAGFVLLQSDKQLYDTAGGIPERIAVYTIIAWEVVTGVAILIVRARARGGVEPVAVQA